MVMCVVDSGGPAPGRGAPRGAAPGRGAPRGVAGAPRGGGAPPMRGASRGRGGGVAPPPPQPSSYDDYGYGGSSVSIVMSCARIRQCVRVANSCVIQGLFIMYGEGRLVILMSPTCPESQGCRFGLTFLCSLLFFCQVLLLFLSYPFLVLAHSADLFFP